MSIIAVILVIAVAGFLAFLVLQIPMPPIFKNAIYAVMAIFLVIWLLQTMGFHTGLPRLRF